MTLPCQATSIACGILDALYALTIATLGYVRILVTFMVTFLAQNAGKRIRHRRGSKKKEFDN